MDTNTIPVKTNIDVAFIDAACSKNYDYDIYKNEPLGGSEGATVRLAEGFASKGLSVSVIQKYDFLPTVSPKGVHYLPTYWANVVKPKNIIFIRAKGKWELFPNSNKFLWIHDACTEGHNNLYDWVDDMNQHNVLSICVSRWHKSNIKKHAPGINIKSIYSPVDQSRGPSGGPYDPFQLVWMASPHKGLLQALGTFLKLYKKDPRFKLVVFNPGYSQFSCPLLPNVVYINDSNRKSMLQILSKSLCLFYPTYFLETFGMIAAEANQVGTPIANYGLGALAESCNNDFAIDENNLIDQVVNWSKEGKPKVKVNEEFKFENIWAYWKEVLK